MWKTVGVGLGILAIVGGLTAVFGMTLCDFVFDCGCQGWWAAGAAHCNIHTPGVKHCPWCAADTLGQVLICLGIGIPQVLFSFYPGRWNWKRRLPAATIAALAAVLGTAWVSGVVAGYWS
jgi:hypothetical protein